MLIKSENMPLYVYLRAVVDENLWPEDCEYCALSGSTLYFYKEEPKIGSRNVRHTSTWSSTKRFWVGKASPFYQTLPAPHTGELQGCFTKRQLSKIDKDYAKEVYEEFCEDDFRFELIWRAVVLVIVSAIIITAFVMNYN